MTLGSPGSAVTLVTPADSPENLANAVPNSAALPNRSAGVRASARASTCSSAGGTSRTAPRCGTGSVKRLAITAWGVGPVKGGSPASIS